MKLLLKICIGLILFIALLAGGFAAGYWWFTWQGKQDIAAHSEHIRNVCKNTYGPFKKMTFASRMQHKIYWGPLKKPIEWSLKTVLAPWAYIASVIYHDSLWYPLMAKKQMAKVLESNWGRLFRDWESAKRDQSGYSSIGDQPAELKRTGFSAFWSSLKILGTCIKEAPEIAQRRKMTRSTADDS